MSSRHSTSRLDRIIATSLGISRSIRCWKRNGMYRKWVARYRYGDVGTYPQGLRQDGTDERHRHA